MKKICWILVLCLMLTACARQEAPPAAVSSAPAASSLAEPLALESLTVEFLRTGVEAEVLMGAVKALPEELKGLLAAEDVRVEEVTVTMSGSCAATARAAAEGGVDLAFLPAGELAALGEGAEVLLLAGEHRIFLCTSGTDYGRNLAGREAPTWEELDHARWGLTAEDREVVELWLADHYEGNGWGDLSSVTVYESRETLLDAARAGEVDLLAAEEQGDFSLLSETEAFYTWAAVGSGEAADGRLTQALLAALAELQAGEFGALFGPDAYAAGESRQLDPQRRLAVLLG